MSPWVFILVDMIPLSLLISIRNNPRSLSLSLWQIPYLALWFFAGLAPLCMWGFLCAVDPSQHWTQHSRCVLSGQKGRTTLPDLSGISFLMQSRLLLVFSVARVHCWAMVSLLFVPRSFSAEFLSSWSDSSLYNCIELFLPRWGTWCFPLQNSIQSPLDYFSNLPVHLNGRTITW